MTKTNTKGYIEVTGKRVADFVNAGMAIQSAQALEYVVALQGYTTYNMINIKIGRVEVSAHLKSIEVPSIPRSFHYSNRTLSSQPFYNEIEHKANRLRVVTWYFYFKNNKI